MTGLVHTTTAGRRGRAVHLPCVAAVAAVAAAAALATSPRAMAAPPALRASPAEERTARLAVDLGAGFERLDGAFYAVVTPRLLLQSAPCDLHLALPLRQVAMSPAGERGLRDRDFDQRSELLRPLQRLRLSAPGRALELLAAADLGLTLGHGALVDGLRPSLLPDEVRVGAIARAAAGPLAAAVLTEDLTRYGVIGTRVAVKLDGGARPDDGAVTLAVEAVADRDAPTAGAEAATAENKATAPRVAAALALDWQLVRSPRARLSLFSDVGASSHDGAAGWGVDAGATLSAGPAAREALRLRLAWTHGGGAWLPGAFDAGYLLERADLAGEALATRLRRIATIGGVGSGVRAQALWTVVDADERSVALAGELRLLPEVGLGDDDLSAASLQAIVRSAGLAASAGWRRRPGAVHLFGAGMGLWLRPWLRGEARLERALHRGTNGGTHRPRWNMGIAIVAAPSS